MISIGPWTTYHAIQKDARFPRVEDAVPDTETLTTRVKIDPEDARFLAIGP